MPSGIQIVDSLWHCLCPLYYSASTKCYPPLRAATTKLVRRTLPTATSRSIVRYGRPRQLYKKTSGIRGTNQRAQCRNFGEVSRKKTSINEEALKVMAKSPLYEQLHKSCIAGDYDRVQKIVRILVRERGERPSTRLYTALVLANTHAEHGSVQQVEMLLEEMVAEGVNPDSATYHAVLKVLAVHPDYLLRHEILEQLRAKWFPLTSDGWHDVIVGCLRDRQVEIALDHVEQMNEAGISLQPWLHDLFMYIFCDNGDFDEVLRFMHSRISDPEEDSAATLWYYILDAASRVYNHPVTFHAWRQRVEPGYLNPPYGMCVNVLNTAARHGDFRLATDVFRILGQRTGNLQIYHYEALFESYLGAGNLRTALSILPVMIDAKLVPTEATTRPLYLYLREDPLLPPKALNHLHHLKKANRAIPTVAINAIIEAALFHHNLPFAIDTYKLLHTLSLTGPTTATFNAIFRGCSRAGRKDLAMFLAAEMVALNIPPNALTYDRLILVCLDEAKEADFGDAWRYFGEMKAAGWWPRRGTLVAMCKRACERGDERVWDLLEEMEGRGMEVGAVQRWIGENWSVGVKRREEMENAEREMNSLEGKSHRVPQKEPVNSPKTLGAAV